MTKSTPILARRLTAGAFAAVAALASLAFASAPARAQAGPGGLTGVWLLDQDVFETQGRFKLPFTPEAQRVVEAERKAREEGGVVLSQAARKCLPIGMPRMMANEFALQFLETPGLVTVVSEASPLVRSIHLDKTRKPDDQEPGWNGYSIGRWEGPVLVVETTNLNDRISHFPGAGAPKSTTTRITERYRLADGGKALVNEMTFEDPEVLSGPAAITYRYHRADPGAELWEYVCETEAEGWSERFPGDPEFKGAAGAK